MIAGATAPPDRRDGKAIRAFVALSLPEACRPAATATIERLARLCPDARFVRDEALHVTLRFFGWTRRETLAALEEPLRAAASACPPFDMGVRGLGLFPDRGSPRVLWLGVSLPSEAHPLQAACERAAVAAGLAPEPRPFRPHVTLARWHSRVRRPELPDADLGSAPVDRLILYRSDIRPSGSVYTPLLVLPLAGAGPALG